MAKTAQNARQSRRKGMGGQTPAVSAQARENKIDLSLAAIGDWYPSDLNGWYADFVEYCRPRISPEDYERLDKFYRLYLRDIDFAHHREPAKFAWRAHEDLKKRIEYLSAAIAALEKAAEEIINAEIPLDIDAHLIYSDTPPPAAAPLDDKLLAINKIQVGLNAERDYYRTQLGRIKRPDRKPQDFSRTEQRGLALICMEIVCRAMFQSPNLDEIKRDIADIVIKRASDFDLDLPSEKDKFKRAVVTNQLRSDKSAVLAEARKPGTPTAIFLSHCFGRWLFKTAMEAVLRGD